MARIVEEKICRGYIKKGSIMTESNLQEKTPESNIVCLKHDEIDVKQLQLFQSKEVLELMRNIQNFNSDGKVNSLIVPKKKELDF